MITGVSFTFTPAALMLAAYTMLSTPANAAQTAVVTTIAGSPGQLGNVDGVGSSARFSWPSGIALDHSGNFIVANRDGHTIRMMTPEGVVTTLAGTAGVPGSVDGEAGPPRPLFDEPADVVLDASGNLYCVEYHGHTLRVITPGGVVSTLAGMAGEPGSIDGTGASARLNGPFGLARDASGTIYIADGDAFIIRKVTTAGVVTTLAGLAGVLGSADGTGSAARFYNPRHVAVDVAGTLCVSDTDNHTVRKITPSGEVTTFAGSAGVSGSTDAAGSNARFSFPNGLAVNASGTIYLVEWGNHTVRKITSAGEVTTIAGLAGAVGSADGNGSEARFRNPRGIALDSLGNLYVADTANHTIRKVSPAGEVITLAGMAGVPGMSDGQGSAARFNSPTGLEVAPSGDLFVADRFGHTIRKIAPDGTVTTFAGTPGTMGAVDGEAGPPRPLFNRPWDVAQDVSGNIYVTDHENHTVRKISPAGIVSTLAGLAGNLGVSDGTGSSARFEGPGGIDVDAVGNIFVENTQNHTIRKITAAGEVMTFAGMAKIAGSADGSGADARFRNPVWLVVDPAGGLFVSDTDNHTIRRITTAGMVTTLAGMPGQPGTADGTGSSARFYYPSGLALDAFRNLYVVDWWTHAIRKVRPDGIVTTVAGSKVHELTGSADGTGTAARFRSPNSVALDALGNLWVTDTENHTIRKIALSPVIEEAPESKVAIVGTTVEFTVEASGSAPFSYQWRKNGVALSGKTDPSLFLANIAPDDAGSYSVVVTNGTGEATSSGASLTVTSLPSITVQPVGSTVDWGRSWTVSVTATGTEPLGYQWRKDGVVIIDATGASLTISNVTPADAGAYSVAISNSAGTVISSGAPLSVKEDVVPLITLQPTGMVVASLTPFALAVQAAGPGPFTYQWQLDYVDIPGAAGPVLEVQDPQLFDQGTYSVTVTNAYGTVSSHAVAVTVQLPPSSGSHLLNISNRGFVGTGGEIMIPGFVVSSTGHMTVLVRAVGPALQSFGVTRVLEDPELRIMTSDTVLYTNDNWSDNPAAEATAQIAVLVGAFPLPAGGKDAAIVVTLPPGTYTVHAQGKDGGTGTALVEVYEVP